MRHHGADAAGADLGDGVPEGLELRARALGDGRLDVELAEEEIRARLASWTPPPPRYRSGVMAKYARLVSSASTGAVTR